LVSDVTVAASGTISFTTIARPAAASFSTKAVEKAAEKLAAFVGSARVSWTDVASARDVVTNSYSILSFVPCNCLPSLNLRAGMISIFVIVTFDGSTPKPAAMEPATLLTNVASAASDSAVTLSGNLPKSKVRAAFTVYVVIFSMRVVVGAAVVVVGAAVVVVGGVVVVVTSGTHTG